MSVAESFGLTAGKINDLIDMHWPEWVAEAPDLELVPATERLCDWLRKAPPEEADLVLRGLARLAHEGAGTSPDAAFVLAWVMMPSATVLAHQLRTLSEDIDCHVAAQLWISVRTFPWRTTGRVAANLNRNLRKKVLQDLVPTSSPFPPDGDDVVQNEQQPDALEELIEILGDGLKAEVIGQDDVDLLLAVMDAAAQLVPPSGPGIGITGDRVSTHIGKLHGCSPRTIRRRIKRSTGALSQLVQEQQSA